jgi:ketosteroid isomerase-like protein
VSAAAQPSAADDAAAIRQLLVEWYAAYSQTDEKRYREFVTDDYELLEHGTIMTVADDLKAMRSRPPGYRRKDAFDFKSVRVHGDLAYATYFLDSEIVDAKRVRTFRWLESAVLRRVGGRWRAALLHSTRIANTEKPRQ